MRPLKSVILPVALAFLLVGCTDGQHGQKQTIGAVLGGVAGGLLGSRIGGGSGKLAATAIGTVLGGLLGSESGRSMDKADRLYAARVTQTALERKPVGWSSDWVNPDTGNSGTVTPTRTFQAGSGQYCREYQHSITVAGRTEMAYGTACRQPDGSWKIVN